MLECDLSRAILRAVDDDDLSGDPRLGKALLAPVDELAHGQLLVQGGDHDRKLRLGDVCFRDEELDVAVLGQIRCRYDLLLQPRHGGQLTSPC